MYAYIKGIVVEKDDENIVIEANNIGYNIRVAAGISKKLPSVGGEAKVYTYTSVREDAFWLYGFSSKEELGLFKLLITVSGIGPKGAMGLLSVMDADTVKLAIISQDSKMIAKAPGIGAKSAGRIILELKDKIDMRDVLGNNTEDNSESSNQTDFIRQEASEALVALGYTVSDAYRVLQTMTIDENTSVENVIKQALRKMV